MLLSVARRQRRRDVIGYTLALLLCAVCVTVYGLLPPAHHAQFLFLALYPAVIAAAWYGGFAVAAIAICLSGLAADVLVLPPVGSLKIEQWSDILALAAFILSGLLLGIVTEALHRQYEQEREARLEAERVGRQALRFQDLLTALSTSRTPAEVIEACVLECTHSLAAVAGVMFVVSPESEVCELAHAVGLPHERIEQLQRVPLSSRTPVTDAIRTRTIVGIDSRIARIGQYGDAADVQFLPEHEAVVAVPIVVRGRAVAVLGLALAAPRAWTSDDRDFLQTIAKRAGQAFDRARAYELAERARTDAEALRARADQELVERQKAEAALRDSEARYRALAVRTSRLHALTTALSESLTVDAVAHAVVRQGELVVGAQAGAVILLTDNGAQFTTLADDSLPGVAKRGQRFRAEDGMCVTEAVQTRQPVFVGSFADWQKRYWRSASRAADGGYMSTVALPLIADGSPMGVLSFHFTAPVNFDEDYRALLMSVAQHCAQALDRARLYETEHGARADAEAANRLKDDFLSTVSHELRTPLNAILGWAAMLRTGSLDASRTQRALQAIHDNATRQAQLVNELLDLSRISAGRASLDLERLDLCKAIRGTVESILPIAEAKGVDVRVAARTPVHVEVDARRLEQVLLNLLSNAVKFTPAGGKVDVQITTLDHDVELRVADTGIGIESDFIPHVFDPFRQADSNTTRTYGGLGLGLSIAKQLIEAHGGSIRVESAGRDLGAAFILTLPLAARTEKLDAVDRATQEPQPDKLPDLTGVRVLVVDDEPDAREVMACALANCGVTVMTAASAEEALAALEQATVDVLLADIGMPTEDGFSLIRKVRMLFADRRFIPAAAVTAYAREDQRQAALQAGFQMHIPKPVDPPQLARAVASLLENQMGVR